MVGIAKRVHCLIWLTAALPLSAAEKVDYARDIRPILSNYCFQCHGPDAGQRKSDLRLDLKEVAFSTLESGGQALVPGRPDESLLVARVESTDPDQIMPPADYEKKLSSEQIALLKRWVEQGAVWEDHWAFRSPVATEPPTIADQSWVRGPIDRFVRAKLDAEGLTAQPAADAATLLRRVTFDLTGLPPTLEEIDRFALDDSPEAYERVVDRLLESPRYGEHMARYWLDAARYGDTHGLHLDNYRSIWPYRDWVIAAFNRNMPFDRFTVEQVAGDLLPNASLEQRIASGFNRCNVTTSEGGSIDEEWYVRYTVDRVETTATVFMGLTLGCAVCHDHKFDPFTQKEFYQLFAFFNNLTEKPMDGNALDPAPIVRVADRQQVESMAALDVRLNEARTRLSAPQAELDGAESTWVAEWDGRLASLWKPVDWTTATSTGGATLTRQQDGSLLAEGTNPAKDVYELATTVDAAGMTAIKLDCLTDPSLVGNGPGRSSNSNFVLSEIEVEAISVADPSRKQVVPLVQAYADFAQEDGGYLVEKAIDGVVDARNGWGIAGYERHENRTAVFIPREPFGYEGGTELRVRLRHETEFGQHAIGRFKISLASDPTLAPSRLRAWHVAGPFPAASGDEAYAKAFGPETSSDLAQTFEGDVRFVERADLADGAVHSLTGENAATYLARTVSVASPRRIVFGFRSDDALKVWVDGALVLEKSGQRSLPDAADLAYVSLPAGEHRLLVKVVNYGGTYAFAARTVAEEPASELPIVAGLLAPAADGTAEERAKRIRDYYRSRHSDAWRQQKAEVEQLQAERKAIESGLTPSLVMQEMNEVRQAYLLVRGEYDKKGEPVPRRLPTMLPPLPKGEPENRLGLARWLVDPQHPLTARVTVNRFWQQFFGTGLVKTAEDFGIQGDLPTHPELLDWLATDFITHGWDVKRLVKSLVMSSTYRQSSTAPTELMARDPENRLLARGPRHRFDAEVIRDNALALAGLLVERVGGPSVKPYQPPGIWEPVAYPTSNTATYKRDDGEALYRRSLYTFWKRTAHPPSMQTFDAPSREACTVRRARTNTPLQALVLMNDEQFVEASRVFAERLLREPAATEQDRLVRAFRLATARMPSNREIELLTAALSQQRTAFREDPAAAAELVKVGASVPDGRWDTVELATWTMMGNLLLNLHETITKS